MTLLGGEKSEEGRKEGRRGERDQRRNDVYKWKKIHGTRGAIVVGEKCY